MKITNSLRTMLLCTAMIISGDYAWAVPEVTQVPTPANIGAVGPVFYVPSPAGTSGTSTTNSTDAANIIAEENAAALAGGGTIYIPNGQYIINNFGYIPANTTVQCSPDTIISADLPTNWVGTGGITSSAFQINAVDRTRITGCKFIWPLTNNTPHIIQVNAGTHVTIDNNYSYGAGDFLANIGGQHVYAFFNDAESVANGAFDNWDGFVDAKDDYNTASSNSGTNSGLGLIQFTAISIHGTAALAFYGAEAIGNILDDENSGSGQVVEINGYTGATTPVADGQNCVISNNIISIGLTNPLANPWGILVNHGGCTNIDIAHNIFEGNPAITPSHSAISIQDTLTVTGFVEFNKANNWQAANVNGDFSNHAVNGTDVGNQCYPGCVGSLTVDGSGILNYGNDNGSGVFSIVSPVSIANLTLQSLIFSSGYGTFNGPVAITNAGSLNVAGPTQLTGTFDSNQGPKWGTDTQAGVVEVMDSAASQAEITKYQTVSVDAWRAGMDATGNYSITSWAGGSVSCTLVYAVNSSNNLTLGCAADTLTLRGTDIVFPGYLSIGALGTDASGNLIANPPSATLVNPLKNTTGTNWYLSKWDDVSTKCTLSEATGTIEDYPVYVADSTLQITKFGIQTTAAGTGTVLDIGIRADSGSNSPGTLIVDGGQLNPTTIGNITTAAFTATTLTKGEYWIEVETVNVGTVDAQAYCETESTTAAPAFHSFVNSNVLGGSTPTAVIGPQGNDGELCSNTGTAALTTTPCTGGSFALNASTPIPTTAWLATGATK